MHNQLTLPIHGGVPAGQPVIHSARAAPRPEIIWGSGSLTIVNPLPEMEEYLHYWHKHFEKKPGRGATTRNEKILLYKVLCPAPRIIQTYQGFIDAILDIAKKHGAVPSYVDRRVPFPTPRLELMKGFRFGQEAMVRTLLQQDRSGLFKAPTRYGKTTCMINVLRAFPGVRTVLAAPGVDLLGQLVKELKAALPGREIKGLFTGSRDKTPSEDITVCSLDSIFKIEPEDVQLLMIDEPHAAVTSTRFPRLVRFSNARIYGFGATLSGRFDKADKLITGFFGPVLAAKSFQEAVEEGAICPITAWMVRSKFSPFRAWDRNQAYASLIFRNNSYNALVKEIVDMVVPASFQTLIFADEVKQIDLMNQFVTDSQMAIAGRMAKKEREALFEEMVKDKIKRCISTDIFSTGVTFPMLRVIINAASGGSGITSTQKPGRLAQCQPGKKCGHLIDFLWEPDIPEEDWEQHQNAPWMFVVRDSAARMKTYKSLGYDVRVVDDIRQLQID